MANISEIARRAGVSKTAVSFVLNGKYDNLSDATVKRIMKVMEEENYEPSALAKGLATNKTRVYGVLVRQLTHPVETFIVSAIAEGARRENYNVFIADEVIHSGSDEATAVDVIDEQVTMMIRHRVDGLISSSPLSASQLKRLAENSIPVVFIDQFSEACDCVNVDFELGSRLAIRHLHETGKRKVVFLDYDNPMNWRGVQEAVKELPEIRLVHRAAAFNPLDVYAEIAALNERGVEYDAVYVASDWFAVGVYRALEEAGLSIPESVAVVGFDDTFAPFLSPALTTISQPLGEIGRTALRLLRERGVEGYTGPPRSLQLEPKLVKRESTPGPAPGKRELVSFTWQNDFPPGPRS